MVGRPALMMIGIRAVLSLFLSVSLSLAQEPENGMELCPIQVKEHLVTRRPVAHDVTVSETSCSERESNFVRCVGELNGNYTWSKENNHINYVLFILNKRSKVARVNVTYRIESQHEKPKVAFCDIPDRFQITESNDFSELDCRKLTIQGGSNDVAMTFNFETSRVGMEVITQGIKTDLVVTGVHFFGDHCTAPTIEGTNSTVNHKDEETNNHKYSCTVTVDQQIRSTLGYFDYASSNLKVSLQNLIPTSTSSHLMATNFKAQEKTAIMDENNRGIQLATQTVVSLLLMTVVLILIV